MSLFCLLFWFLPEINNPLSHASGPGRQRYCSGNSCHATTVKWTLTSALLPCSKQVIIIFHNHRPGAIIMSFLKSTVKYFPTNFKKSQVTKPNYYPKREQLMVLRVNISFEGQNFHPAISSVRFICSICFKELLLRDLKYRRLPELDTVAFRVDHPPKNTLLAFFNPIIHLAALFF